MANSGNRPSQCSYTGNPTGNQLKSRDLKQPFPDTGWRGQPAIPSQEGGNGEQNFMSKPPYAWKSECDKFVPKYTIGCWCGKVSFEFHGDPVDAKYCHCLQCQRLHGAPFQWAVIFPKNSVRLVKNKSHSLHFFSSEKCSGEHYVPCKISCNVCHSPLFDEGRNTVLAYPSSFLLNDRKVPLDFRPSAHIFYSQRIMDVPDGIPKWSQHKGTSELLQERSEDGVYPRVKTKAKPKRASEGQSVLDVASAPPS